MAQGVAELNPSSLSGDKPPLNMGVRLRLSVMMFLQFAIWGSWFGIWGIYLGLDTSKGGLGFDGVQIGSLYGTMALGGIISMMIAGQLADRVMSSEYLMAIFHLAGAVLLYEMAKIHDYTTLWWVSFAYALIYNPTLSISNSLAFSNIPDSTRDFPTLRVLGTIGWIIAGLAVDYLLPKGADGTNKPLLMAAGLSGVLGLLSLALPHTPPTGKKGDAVPFLRALKLLADPSFGIFFGISFIITIALAFYYGFANQFLKDAGVQRVAATMTIGQWSEIFFMLMLPLALKKFGMKGVLGVGMAAWAVRYGIFSLGHPLWLVVGGLALHGVCFDFFLAAGFIHTDNKAPADIRGSAQAPFSFLTYGVGMWIGNVISGGLKSHYTHVINAAGDKVVNWTSMWAIPAIGAAVCLVLFLILWRDKPGKVDETVSAEAMAEPLV